MSLLYLFTDSDKLIRDWSDFEEMMAGAESCRMGLDLPEDASQAFQYGYAQEYHEGERNVG